MSNFTNIFQKFWEKYNYVYNKQKELCILSEEYDNELCTFVQPIKEQKDSLDHITRAYKDYYDSISCKNSADAKIEDNLDKALGHIFRAYYDTADFLSIVIRRTLSMHLQQFTYKQIITVWREYEDNRRWLVTFPTLMAGLRNNKGINSSFNDIKEKVDAYYEPIEHLFELFNTFMLEVYPKLCKRYDPPVD